MRGVLRGFCGRWVVFAAITEIRGVQGDQICIKAILVIGDVI
jgi:hypothetical protein